MTPTERETYRQLQGEIKRRRNLGESNLIIRNGKIVQYGPRKFQTRVLVNDRSTAIKEKDTSALEIGHDSPTADHNHTPMDQDQSTIVKDKVTHPPTTIESESSTTDHSNTLMDQDKTASS